jgi:putative ABC transport system permease protein
MKFIDLVSLVFYNLGRRKGRVVLTAIGVVIGTAAVVILVSLAVGLQKNATSQLWGINDLSSIEVYPGFTESAAGSSGGMKGGGGGGGGGGSSDGMKYLTPAAIESIKVIPGVSNVIIEDYLQNGGDLAFGKLHNYANIMGVNVNDLQDMGLAVSSGTTQLDKGTAVVGSWFLQSFYDPKARPGDDPVTPPDLLGQQVKMTLYKYTADGQVIQKNVTFRVVGILSETKGNSDSMIYMRLDDVTAFNEWSRGTRINRNKEGYSIVIVKADDVKSVIDITKAINDLGYQAYTPQSTVQSINSFFLVLQVVFGGVGAIALLVAAIGIANTMTMAILERTREIGIMKAIGAKNKDILSIFLGEAAGIGLVGGIGGICIGWVASKLLNVIAISYFASQSSSVMGSSLSMVTSTPIWLVGFALIFSILVGLLSGLVPAIQAASLIPVNALKYE